jgi:hypothetical protein
VSRRRSEQDQQLQQVWDQIPQLNCRGLCASSCGPIDASSREKQRLRARGIRLPPREKALHVLHTTGNYRCPALTSDEQCSAYTDRPTICRLWGAIDALRCPHGCQPHSPPLDDSTALQLLTASLHVGGDTGNFGTGPLPRPEDIARALQNPALAATIRNLLRSQATLDTS